MDFLPGQIHMNWLSWGLAEGDMSPPAQLVAGVCLVFLPRWSSTVINHAEAYRRDTELALSCPRRIFYLKDV